MSKLIGPLQRLMLVFTIGFAIFSMSDFMAYQWMMSYDSSAAAATQASWIEVLLHPMQYYVGMSGYVLGHLVGLVIALIVGAIIYCGGSIICRILAGLYALIRWIITGDEMPQETR